MVLRAEDIAAWSVNWKSKSDNLQQLADTLHLAIDSFVFLDDDPAVRRKWRCGCPASTSCRYRQGRSVL
jgi:predicted enzyme involved in methoxymalonyl-ACP biosynthesis